jgi:hypothetical protein
MFRKTKQRLIDKELDSYVALVEECNTCPPNTFPFLFAVKKNEFENIMVLERDVLQEFYKDGKDPIRA